MHRPEVLARLVADLRTQGADHIAVTGDLVNLGMPSEHERGLRWLKELGRPADVSVIPGNHDIYSPLWRDCGIGRWRAYMSGFGSDDGDCREAVVSAGGGPDCFSGCVPSDRSDGRYSSFSPASFPYVRVLGKIALIGVNSAIPTKPGRAVGLVDHDQLGRLAKSLDELARRRLFRVVMIHHPPLVGQARPRRALMNADEMEALLLTYGAELVLHGHNHRNMLAWRTWEGQSFPVVGVPSASAAWSWHGEPLARYNLYDISDLDGERRVEMIGRGVESGDGPVVELERRSIAAGAGEGAANRS